MKKNDDENPPKKAQKKRRTSPKPEATGARRWQIPIEEDDEDLDELFRVERRDTHKLEQSESFIQHRLTRSDIELPVGMNYDRNSREFHAAPTPTPHGLQLPHQQQQAHKAQSKTKFAAFADDTHSIGSVRSGTATPASSAFPLARRRKKKSETSIKPQIYAGITHSDLDIQYYRPPLMYAMNVLEWLWLQSSEFHRTMILILALLFCVVLANLVFAFLLLFGKASQAAVPNPYLCESQECENMVKRIKETMNKTWDPCDNFYAFVCGTDGLTTGLTAKEEELWTSGNNYGRIRLDFHKSISLGNLFKKRRNFPQSLILTFYKGCLNDESRNARGLQPYYNMLKKFGLYSIDKATTHTMEDLIFSITSALSHSLKYATILREGYYFDANGELRMFVGQSVPAAYKSGGPVSYGYDNYKSVVKNAFILLSELNVPTSDLDIIAHDIVCLELTIKDRWKVPAGKNILSVMDNDPSIASMTCPMPTDAAAAIPGNFGQDAMTGFDWDLFVKKLWEMANPDWPPGTPIPIVGNPSTDSRTSPEFLKDFDTVVKQSAPLRLLRYLQWRLLYTLAYDLSDEVIKTTVHVRRHHFFGVAGCIQRTFFQLPFLTPDAFLHSIKDRSALQVEQDFGKLMHRVSSTYYKVVARTKFKEYEKYVNRQLEPRELRLLQEIVAASLRTDEVAPVTYEDRFFPRFPELYKGISMSEDEHFENTLKMGYRMQQWKLTKPYQDIFFSIHSRFHTPMWMDKIQANYERSTTRYVIYLPFATVEVPYFRDGLEVSDFGGAGWVYAEAIERSSIRTLTAGNEAIEGLVHYLTQPNHRNLVNKGYTVDEIREMLTSLTSFIQNYYFKEKYLQHYENEGWKVGEDEKWDFRYTVTKARAFEDVFLDQRRYHVLTLMLDEFLAKKENWKHRKALLPGLEEFNAKQLFYISLVGRRCDPLGRTKFDFVKLFGPAHYLVTNIALSNLDHFAETFKCPEGSKMNPDSSQKLYFWDRDVNISHFSVNETELEFLDSN